jgi:glycine/D-amino acid oxidase-like deaminating enzyme
VVRGLGVPIYENTPVLGISDRCIDTAQGKVSAEVILRATEGYTDSIPTEKRQLMPLYSMMVATEPLPDSVWQDIGLSQRETFGDGRRVVIYGQRTADNRFAFGGRAGYFYGSKRKPVIPPGDPALDQVEATLRALFPQLAGYAVSHRWGGLMGVPRHWRPSVSYNPQTGLGAAGGYTGEGVAASNLAGRILADLVCGVDGPLTNLAWVNDTPRRWEPEPLRWLGARAIEYFGERADRSEAINNEPSQFWGGLFDRLVR